MSDSQPLRATHQGELKIGENTLPVAVLEDGTRVITMTAVFRAFRRTTRSRINVGNRVNTMPSFLDAQNLQPFVSQELKDVIGLITYLSKSGKETTGYNALILPLLCDVYLSAQDAGALTKKQIPQAAASEILVRSLSKVGILALVDEATGYQAERDRDELQKILSAYISAELLPWTKRFPDEFYEQMFRLRDWQYRPLSTKRPLTAGKLTNQIVYEKLPPGVLDDLRRKNPTDEAGRRKHKHHQFLTMDVGNPHLEKHLAVVTTLMRISPNWRVFMSHFARAFPPPVEQMPLFEEEEETDN